ncbi:hypothetical protein AB9F45_36500, partial [Rhizobium leguminosarum]
VVSGVERVTVNNPGPFTFLGTNSYIVGSSSVAVIDPGPEDESHYQALMAALGARAVTHIFVSHTHRIDQPAPGSLLPMAQHRDLLAGI